MSHQFDCCRDFRSALARALEGRPQPEALVQLSWHEHLLGCGECRELLEHEEALEALLASLPEPQLPPDLTQRVIRRLEGECVELDALLELDDSAVPVGLAERIVSGVRREQALDALLALDEVDRPAGLAARIEAGVRAGRALDALLDANTVEVPAGLAAGVLVGLEPELSSTKAVPARPLRLVRTPFLYAAAASLLLFFFIGDGQREVSQRGAELARLEAPAGPDPELLEMLDVLERDELWADSGNQDLLLMSGEDLELLLCETVDIDDELLLAFLADEEPSDG